MKIKVKDKFQIFAGVVCLQWYTNHASILTGKAIFKVVVLGQ